MTDITRAALAAAADASRDDDLADVAQAAEATLRNTAPQDAADAADDAETDPVLANAARTPRKGSFQERIAEMTRARRDAERERDLWRQEALMRRQAPAQAVSQGQGGPDPADYPHGPADAGFIRDHARFEAQHDMIHALKEQAARQTHAAVHSAWHDRQAQFAAQAPDYHAVFDRDWHCSPMMADAIITSEEGPAVAYHLALNPHEARRIATLPPLAQVRALGRLEAVANSGSHQRNANAVSNAPTPPPTARGSGARFRVSPDTEDFASFDRAY